MAATTVPCAGLATWANAVRLQLAGPAESAKFGQHVESEGFDFLRGYLEGVLKEEPVIALAKTPGRKKDARRTRAHTAALAASALKIKAFSFEDGVGDKENLPPSPTRPGRAPLAERAAAPLNDFHRTLLKAQQQPISDDEEEEPSPVRPPEKKRTMFAPEVKDIPVATAKHQSADPPSSPAENDTGTVSGNASIAQLPAAPQALVDQIPEPASPIHTPTLAVPSATSGLTVDLSVIQEQDEDVSISRRSLVPPAIASFEPDRITRPVSKPRIPSININKDTLVASVDLNSPSQLVASVTGPILVASTSPPPVPSKQSPPHAGPSNPAGLVRRLTKERMAVEVVISTPAPRSTRPSPVPIATRDPTPPPAMIHCDPSPVAVPIAVPREASPEVASPAPSPPPADPEPAPALQEYFVPVNDEPVKTKTSTPPRRSLWLARAMGGSDAHARKSTNTVHGSSSTPAARVLAARHESTDVEARRAKPSLGFFATTTETPAGALKRKSTVDGNEIGSTGESEIKARKSVKVTEGSYPGGDVPSRKGKEKDTLMHTATPLEHQQSRAPEPTPVQEQDEDAMETTEEYRRAAAHRADLNRLEGLVALIKPKTERTMTGSVMDHTSRKYTFNLSELSKDEDDASESGSGSDGMDVEDEVEVEDMKLEDMRATVTTNANTRAVSADMDESDDEHDAEGDVAMILAQPNGLAEVESTTPPHSPPPVAHVLNRISHAPSVPGPRSPVSFPAPTAATSSTSSSKASDISGYSIFSAPKTGPSSAASSLFNVPISEPAPPVSRRDPSISTTVFSKPKPAVPQPKSSTTPVAKEHLIEPRPVIQSAASGSSIFSSFSAFNPFSRPAKSESTTNDAKLPDTRAISQSYSIFSRAAKSEPPKEEVARNSATKGPAETRTQLQVQHDDHNPFLRPTKPKPKNSTPDDDSEAQTQTQSQVTQTSTWSSLASGASWFNPPKEAMRNSDEEGYDTDITGSDGGGSQEAVIEMVKTATVAAVKPKPVIGKPSAAKKVEPMEDGSDSDFAVIDDGLDEEEAISVPASKTRSAKVVPSTPGPSTRSMIGVPSTASKLLTGSKRAKDGGPIKSLVQAQAIKQREQEEKDKKAARAKTMEDRRLALAQRKADEDRTRQLELEQRKKDEGEKRKRERDDLTATAAVKASKKKAEDELKETTKKRKMDLEKKAPESKKLVMKSSVNRPAGPKVGLNASQSAAQQAPPALLAHPLQTKGSLASLRNAPPSMAGPSASSIKLVAAVVEPSKQAFNTVYTKNQVATASSSSSSYKQPSHAIQSQMAARIQLQIDQQREMQAKGKGVAEEKVIADEDIDLPDINSEYSDSDDEDRVKFDAPDWADPKEVAKTLKDQDRMNPDDIFGPVPELNMEQVFKTKSNKFRPRSSSANWGGSDRLTEAEKLDYARRMGFKRS